MRNLLHGSPLPCSQSSIVFCRRIKSLEAQVSEIRQTQHGIHNTLVELLHQVRSGSSQGAHSGNVPFRQSPNNFQAASPASLSTPTSTAAMAMDTSASLPHEGPNGSTFQGQMVLPPLVNHNHSRQSSTPRPAAGLPYRSSPAGLGQRGSGDMNAPHLPAPNTSFPPSSLYPQGSHGPTLPPISSFQDITAARHAPTNLSSVRSHTEGQNSPRHHGPKHPPSSGHHSPKRKAGNSSNVTSSNTSDYGDEDDADLPEKGLVAPWEVLRGLADVAVEMAAQVSPTNVLLITCTLPPITGKRREQRTQQSPKVSFSGLEETKAGETQKDTTSQCLSCYVHRWYGPTDNPPYEPDTHRKFSR